MSELDEMLNAKENSNNGRSGDSFNKEEWALQKRQEREAAYELIDNEAEAASMDGAELRTVLDVMARFDRYSVGNALLIAAQKPDAVRLQDFNSWKKDGAYIRKGENGITIMEPGEEYTREDGSVGVSYNTKKLFDISQTSYRDHAPGQVVMDARLLLKGLISEPVCNIKVGREDEIPENTNALYFPQERTVYVRKGCETETAFREIAREFSLASQDKGDGNYSRSSAFFTAYCAAYVMCKRYGIQAEAFDFSRLPDNVMTLNAQEMRKTLGEIRDSANSMSLDISRFMERQNEARKRTDGAR